MFCILELGCTVIGVIILALGRIPMGADREVKGAGAYIVGGLLVGIGPLAYCVSYAMGLRDVQVGRPGELREVAFVTQLGLIFAGVIAALVLALTSAKPKRRKKRRRIVDDGYDDFDRRGQKRWDEIEDEKESRPSNSDDERPRRRRSYDDDDDYDRRRRRY
jgi:hypothetical protein